MHFIYNHKQIIYWRYKTSTERFICIAIIFFLSFMKIKDPFAECIVWLPLKGFFRPFWWTEFFFCRVLQEKFFLNQMRIVLWRQWLKVVSTPKQWLNTKTISTPKQWLNTETIRASTQSHMRRYTNRLIYMNMLCTGKPVRLQAFPPTCAKSSMDACCSE